METARINLTIPGPVDDLLGQMATVTGQSKSSLIASILTLQMPRLRQWLDAYQSGGYIIGMSGVDLPDAPSMANPKRQGPARHNTAEKRSEALRQELSRQERRAQERREAKEKRRAK